MRYRMLIVLMVFAMASVLTAVLSVLDAVFTGEAVTRGDLATDFVEMLVLSTAMVASIGIVDRLRNLEADTSVMRTKLSEAALAGEAWRRQSEYMFQGLSTAVAGQFDEWGLTEAEADIAALILKGAPLRDIAKLRKTSEATIRQQAQSVYRKSGLSNRSELAAYFLEDLFDVAKGRAALGGVDHSTH